MTYVLDQTSAELRDHMKRISNISGWDDPLSSRLWAEVQALDAVVLRLEEEKSTFLADPRGSDTANHTLPEDKETAELFQSERISAALATYDYVLGDADPSEPDHEVRTFDAMKAAIQRADHIARTGEVQSGGGDALASKA